MREMITKDVKKAPIFKNAARTLLALSGAAAIFSVAAPSAQATLVTLADGNSTTQYNTSTQDGMFSWLVDGNQQFGLNSLAQQSKQWFWYRVGSSGPEASIDTLTQSSITSSANILNVVYTGTGFTVGVTYSLTGGSVGSGQSSVTEAIKIHNTTGSALDMHFFQYSDFNVAGIATPNTVTITGATPNTADQTAAGASLDETVTTPAPSRYQVALVDTLVNPSTANSLNDSGPTTLTNAAGPLTGDVSWAFQWDKSIAGNSDFIISKVKSVQVPEPASATLIALAAPALLMRRRRSAADAK